MKKSLILFAVTYLLPPLLWLYFSSLRVREINAEWHKKKRAAGENVIFLLLHEYMLLPLSLNRHQGVWVLVSQHFDGELITRVLHFFGFRTVRGSSTRGGLKALIEMRKRLIKEGGDVAITPDGPRGPRREVKAGAIQLALSTGRPLVLAGVYAPTAWRFKSWDHFCLMKPFSRCTVLYSDPIVPPAEKDPAALNHFALELGRQLDALEREGARILEGRE